MEKRERKKRRGGIYQIRCLVNNKIYVGSCVDFIGRKNKHFGTLISNNHMNRHLQNSFNKYGRDQFVFEILEYVDDKNKLIEVEQAYTDRLQSYDRSIGFNIRRIARSNLGVKYSPESCMAISRANTGRKHTPEVIARRIGYKHPEITKNKISTTLKGHRNSEEARKKMSEALRGKPKKYKLTREERWNKKLEKDLEEMGLFDNEPF
jgi:group I intron endonuclease